MKSLVLFVLTALLIPNLNAQQIRAPKDHFQAISDHYASITDYQANLTILQGDTRMEGVIYYKSPHRVRINFTRPANQIIVSDGRELNVFLPESNVVYKQALPRRGSAAVTQMMGEGLRLMLQNFGIAYLRDPGLSPIEDNGTGEMVHKFRLSRTNYNESYRQLIVSVLPNNLIRRISGINQSGISVQFDFSSIRLNQGLPDSFFDYENQPTANTIENFLFDPEN